MFFKKKKKHQRKKRDKQELKCEQYFSQEVKSLDRLFCKLEIKPGSEGMSENSAKDYFMNI